MCLPALHASIPLLSAHAIAHLRLPVHADNLSLSFGSGRIKALQLDYSEAHEYLMQAARKAPTGAVGFLQHVHKLDVIVTMLLGELPERELFRRQELAAPLEPYFQLTHG